MRDFEQVKRLLEEYKEQYGDLLVPQGYKTENGIHLGKMVSSIRSGNRKTSVEEKEILNELGFVWKLQHSFDEVISLLKEYKEQYDDLLVPDSYKTEKGVNLGTLVCSIRTGRRKLSDKEKEILNELGFVWKIQLSFDEVLSLLKEYKEQFGNLLVPVSYRTENGIKLGRQVQSIRTGNRKTSAEEKTILNELGFVWEVVEKFSFDEVISLLKEYKEQYGDLLVPSSYKTKNGIRLGIIVSSIRTGNRKTSDKEKEILNKLGFVWKIGEKRSFDEVISLLKEYKKQYGDLLVPQMYKTPDDVKLGRIVHSIRTGNRKTSAKEKAKLNKLGFVWNPKRGRKNK